MAHDGSDHLTTEGDYLPLVRTAWWQRMRDDRSTYEITRWLVVRLLALVYLAAFVSLAVHLDPLLGSHGLLPVKEFMARERVALGGSALWRTPTLFWLTGASDGVMRAACWVGVLLAAAALLGATNALLQLALWLIYGSFVHVGQIFFGYGWELQLLETGFLAVFLCPVRGVAPMPRTRAPRLLILLLRWLIFRVMMGSALIKLRHDPCWIHLTCLDYHFETQPNPGPLSWWLHRAPHSIHAGGVVFTLAVELVVPWFAFGFRRSRHVAGVLLVLLQLFLILSGNLSFLNWLTLVPALACFDDSAFIRATLPAAWRRRLRITSALAKLEAHCRSLPPSAVQERAVGVLGVFVAILSIAPAVNLASCDQSMNRSFDPLALVNSYGAFGDVDRARYEVILEGTMDAFPVEGALWEQYELPCMPGDPRRRPCLVSPYHYRLDWQFWFVGNGAATRGETIDQEPWLVHLVWKLLEGGQPVSHLLTRDPFAGTRPRWLRASVWRYRFTEQRRDGWWQRERVSVFLPPVSIDDSDLHDYVQEQGWRD
ncbi:MAG: lipase maturation factor family protein [Myxococcota bacterium]|nr:lipase maturation factor family protein [Myxococcota bacterium]